MKNLFNVSTSDNYKFLFQNNNPGKSADKAEEAPDRKTILGISNEALKDLKMSLFIKKGVDVSKKLSQAFGNNDEFNELWESAEGKGLKALLQKTVPELTNDNCKQLAPHTEIVKLILNGDEGTIELAKAIKKDSELIQILSTIGISSF